MLTSTLLDDLHRAHPNARLDFCTTDAVAPVIENHPLIARRIPLRKRFFDDVRAVRAGRYDWLVDTWCTPRSAAIAAFSGIPVRAGYAVRPPRVYAYTHRVPRNPTPPLYSALDRKRLLGALGIATQPSTPKISLSDAEREHGRALLRSLGVRSAAPLVGVTLAASMQRNRWPVERWADVCDAIDMLGAVPVMFAAPGDEAATAAFAVRSSRAVVIPPRALRDFLAMLAACAVVVSPDSGPSHIARAVGARTVTIYVRGRAAVWGPGTSDAIALEASPDVECPQCAMSLKEGRDVVHACLLAIDVNRVANAVERQLNLVRAS
ncbi:MAG TPA: glycosyltransferase family 9 protein [Gemmatimonadaceae bacterium]|nr:glycosyltransferase family 9 protein [Gemmatimonadaceae bacterium]